MLENGRVLRIFVALALLALPSFNYSQTLRPPATPLVVHDPYFSIWSMSDKLTDQATKHWTGVNQSMCSLIRIDGRTFRVMGPDPKSAPALDQTSLQVLPTHTVYEFSNANIKLRLTFSNPLLASDLELVSRPASYVTWRVESADGATHQVQLYFDASSQIAVNTPEEPVAWGRYLVGDGLTVLRVGTRDQPVLQKSGDNLRIDWGYLYVTAPKDAGTISSVGGRTAMLREFMETGHVSGRDELESFQPYSQPIPVLAESFDLGPVSSPVARHAVIAYDDEFSLEYLNRRVRPYWRRNGTGAAQMLVAALNDYQSVEERTAAFDKQLMADLKTAGGEEYAELCALAYPQTMAAHKLGIDVDGGLLFFSKENFSNGSIDTVDVTYPSSPFFLLFNPRLLQAQIEPVFIYANLPRWRFPFAPHDLGRYPLANGQQYGGGEKTEENQMPVEESGNLLLITAALVKVDGNAEFAGKYWPLLSKWAEFLKAKGLDPENQLSTDDFAGHLAHNANLSAKAILALGAYGKMAGALGHADLGKQYLALARDYAQRWVKMDNDGDHYRLAFDRPGTWSQKYNLVWDRLLDLHLFPQQVIDTELKFYAAHTNTYGLPLDNRADYTKLDWLAWTASLSGSRQGFEALFDPAFRFANESPSRVPLTDWYDTKTAKQVGFQARSVVGGIFIEMLNNQSVWKRYADAYHSKYDR